jgi:hypothetical protein
MQLKLKLFIFEFSNNFSSKVRYVSQKKGFLGGFFENLKEEYNKNKEMKESIKKFRDQAQKLEESDALKEARKKYVLEISTCLDSIILNTST